MHACLLSASSPSPPRLVRPWLLLLWAILRLIHARCVPAAATAKWRGCVMSMVSLNLFWISTGNPRIGPFASLFLFLPSFLPFFSCLACFRPTGQGARSFARGFDNRSGREAVLDYFRVHKCRPSQKCIIGLVITGLMDMPLGERVSLLRYGLILAS